MINLTPSVSVRIHRKEMVLNYRYRYVLFTRVDWLIGACHPNCGDIIVVKQNSQGLDKVEIRTRDKCVHQLTSRAPDLSDYSVYEHHYTTIVRFSGLQNIQH